jgi:hypothetical protein
VKPYKLAYKIFELFLFKFLALSALLMVFTFGVSVKAKTLPGFISRKPASAKPIFDVDFATVPTPGPSPESIKKLLRKVATERANCERSGCTKAKILKLFEESLKSYADLLGHDRIMISENASLRSQLKTLESAIPTKENHSCFKTDLMREVLINYGISENGDSIFSKKSMQQSDSQCWTNGRKKIPSTVTICSFPLAINIQTMGGSSSHSIARLKEYIFALNGCDLLTVHIKDEGEKNQARETHLSYNMCIEKWNRRTADASMNPQEVALMEDTIGFCFREHLLPPMRSKSGRQNPLVNFDRTLSSEIKK